MHLLVKQEVDKMVELGAISPVNEPTDWVSSLAYNWKASGPFRICLDPRDLSAAICCEYHRTPIVEEGAHEFVNFKFFTKPDAHHGY